MIKTTYMNIKGMHCINCPNKVERAVSNMAGVTKADVSWDKQQGNFTFERDQITVSDIIRRIHEMGFEAKEI